MNDFPMSEGLEIVRNLTEKGNKNLHYFDKEQPETEETPVKQGFDFERMWRRISFITIAIFIVCAGFNIANDFTNILVLVMIVSLAGWFICAVVEGKRQGFRLQVPATKTSTGELDQGYEFSQDELNKIGLAHELLDIIEENDNRPAEVGIAFFNPTKVNSPLDKQIKDIINLLVFAKLTDFDSQADQLIENYTVMQAIATGLMQTAKVGEGDADDFHDLSKQYVKRLDDLENKLYKLILPKLSMIVMRIIEQKDYQLLPDELSKTIVHSYNHKLLSDLKEEDDD